MGYMYALSWKLLIIELLLEYVATLLKILHPMKIDKNVPYFFTNCTFSYGKVRDFFRDKDQISSGRAKEGVREGMGEKPKMRVNFAKFPTLSKIQTLSHKLLVRQTSNHHHCNWHAEKPISRDFQVISSSSS